MTVEVRTVAVIMPFVFAMAALPLTRSNLRTGHITNADNAILVLGGLGVLLLNAALETPGFRLPAPSLWLLVALIPLAAYGLGWLSGGAAKFLIALLPWFSPLEYLLVTSAGLLLAGMFAAVLRRKEVQIATPVVVTGFLVLVVSAANAWRP